MHHIDSTIPHYEAKRATAAVAAAFPDLYLYEESTIPSALWRVATSCFGVEERPLLEREQPVEEVEKRQKHLYVFVDR